MFNILEKVLLDTHFGSSLETNHDVLASQEAGLLVEKPKRRDSFLNSIQSE